MKSVLIAVLLFVCLSGYSQDSLQFARLKNLQGKTAAFSIFTKNDPLILICFWSASSEESITELNSINVNLEKWQTLKPFRFMAVSVDEGKSAGRMRPTYNMNGWTFDSYADLYGEMRRALHSNNLPQSIILHNGQIIYSQNGWAPGSENYLIEKILSVKN